MSLIPSRERPAPAGRRFYEGESDKGASRNTPLFAPAGMMSPLRTHL
jgi:hypothetical protein